MRVMGFSHDPGRLPLITLRSDKWANRLTVGEIVQIQGENGCRLPKTPARVVRLDEYPHACPPDLDYVYRGQRLWRVYLAPVDPDDPDLAQYMFPV